MNWVHWVKQFLVLSAFSTVDLKETMDIPEQGGAIGPTVEISRLKELRIKFSRAKDLYLNIYQSKQLNWLFMYKSIT